jgi:flavin-dependent dehydrogenase
MPARIGKQAVVVGAGMAGLTAARSLADFFERVIVLENDALRASSNCEARIATRSLFDA